MPSKKSRKKPTSSREIVMEFMGWKTGDLCYALLAGDSKPTKCEILEFHPDDKVSPSVSLLDAVSGKYRVSAVEIIADSASEAKKKGSSWWKKISEEKLSKDAE